MALERLQKVLARAGVASRRHAEDLIVAGRVSVGGRVVTELGTRVDPQRDRVEVDGKRVVAEPLVYLVFHKPRGVVSTMRDPEGRPTVADYVSRVEGRVVPVGRLDFHTSGVLLLTNDGDFALALSHPKKGVEKVYVAKVQGVLDDEGLERFRQSISIEGRPTRPADVHVLRVTGDKTWIEVRLREGKNRQVRRLGEAAGFPVLRLARTEHAGITAEGLRPGAFRHLTLEELARLKKAHGVPRRLHAPPKLDERQARPPRRIREASKPARAQRAQRPVRAPARKV